MIDEILSRDLFRKQPPVLVDVGASGGIHPRWKPIAKYAHCIAFDADDREMKMTESDSSGFLRLVTVNRIVTEKPDNEVDFYLTASPFCSSTLEPDPVALSRWPFASLFTVEKKVRLKAVRLSEALQNAGVTNIDWLKIDTQGTDLRIFRSLPKEMQQKVLVAEFEPGILDAYKGEDKLYDLMRHMHEGFFMSSLDLKGVVRMSPQIADAYGTMSQRALRTTHRTAPGWAEVTFMNCLDTTTDTRSFQLLYVFALMEKQYGFAMEIAQRGKTATGEALYDELNDHAQKQISRLRYKWPFFGIRNRLARAFEAVFN